VTNTLLLQLLSYEGGAHKLNMLPAFVNYTGYVLSAYWFEITRQSNEPNPKHREALELRELSASPNSYSLQPPNGKEALQTQTQRNHFLNGEQISFGSENKKKTNQ